MSLTGHNHPRRHGREARDHTYVVSLFLFSKRFYPVRYGAGDTHTTYP